MLNIFLRYKRPLAGISDFAEDIVSEAGSDSSSIFSHDGSKSDTDSDRNTEPLDHISRRVVAMLYSIDNSCKAYNYQKVAGDNFKRNFCYVRERNVAEWI